jgi:hypothetical protein
MIARLFRLTAFDWLLARRAGALGSGLVVVLAIIVVSTDEQASSLGARLGRLASLVVLAGALGAFLTTEQARARGELRAVSALGVRPARASLGAAIGGSLVALLGPALVLLRGVDLSPMFPRLEPGGGVFRALGRETVLELSRGIVIEQGGALSMVVSPAASALPGLSLPRVATAVALLLSAASIPYWSTLPGRARPRAVVGALTVLSFIVLFHLVAAGRGSAWLLPLAPLLLLSDAVRHSLRDG